MKPCHKSQRINRASCDGSQQISDPGGVQRSTVTFTNCMNKYIMNYLNIMNTVHYIQLVFLYPTFHAPTVHIPLQYILLHFLAISSGSIIFNSSIFGTTSGSKHLSKRAGKMQDEVLLAAIKQGNFGLCDTKYVNWEARVDKVTRLMDG